MSLPPPPPAVPGGPVPERMPDVRVSDRERDDVASTLREHAAVGRLTFEELDQRLEATAQARTRGELVAVLTDLPPRDLSRVRPGASPGRVTTRGWVVAVLSDDVREGRFTTGSRAGVVAGLGNAQLDLRQAEITTATLDVDAYALLGTVVVIVPEGAAVEVSRVAVLGNIHVEVEGEVRPGAPVVRVRAVSVLGDVHIRSSPRPPGWFARTFRRGGRPNHADRR